MKEDPHMKKVRATVKAVQEAAKAIGTPVTTPSAGMHRQDTPSRLTCASLFQSMSASTAYSLRMTQSKPCARLPATKHP